jgi:hypothetical protein
MPLSTTTVEQSYLAVAAGVPIAGIPIAADSVAHVVVKYGDSKLTAVQGVDYNVVLAGDFNSMTVTPTASLITKIGAGTNIIYVRRVSPTTTTFSATDATYKQRISDEIRHVYMIVQELVFDIVSSVGLITNDKLAQMAAGTVKGRRAGVGTGVVVDIALADLKTDMAFVKGDVGLGNVDNTSDANKPVSTAQQTALNGKSDTNHTHSNVPNSWLATMAAGTVKANITGGVAAVVDVTLAALKTAMAFVKGDVGLGNVDNTSDANKPVSTAQQAALDLKQSISEKNIANGYAGLNADGLLDPSTLPGLAINDTFTVNSQAAMLALASAEKGDMAVRTDENKTYVLSTNSPGTLADWKQILTPAGGGDMFGPAGAVAGRRAAFADTTGKTLSDPGPIALSELATQAANTIVMNNTGGAAAPTAVAVATAKTALGINNVDNTSDANKPVSTAQQTALDGKVPTTRTVTAGNGLTGGGDLSANRTFDVGAGAGISVAADAVAVDKASSAQIYAATADKVLTSDNVATAQQDVAMTASATPAFDWTAGLCRSYTPAQNFTLQNPTGEQVGTWREIVFTQVASLYTIAFGSEFRAPSGSFPAMPTTSGHKLRLGFKCRSGTEFEVYELGRFTS